MFYHFIINHLVYSYLVGVMIFWFSFFLSWDEDEEIMKKTGLTSSHNIMWRIIVFLLSPISVFWYLGVVLFENLRKDEKETKSSKQMEDDWEGFSQPTEGD